MTTKTTHTPGPWSYEKAAYGDNGEWSVSTRIRRVAIVNNGADNAETNARLIAAAPELLENLEIALAAVQASWFDMENGIQEHLRQANKSALMDIRLNIEAAIAKAKGDTP